MYRLIVRDGILYGVDEYYCFGNSVSDVEKNSKFFIKSNKIVGCKEKLKYDKFYEKSYYDIVILIAGENEVSVSKSFNTTDIKTNKIKEIKKLIHSLMCNSDFQGEVRF